MKTRRDIFGGLMLAAAALVCLTGCKKDDEGEKVVLGADFEQTAGTQKTYVGNGDRTIYWNTDDAVLVNGEEYTVNEGAVEVKLANSYYAVYPATEANKNVTADGGAVVIPATQEYTKKDGHQVLGGPMAARLDNKTGRLLFRNLYAVIKVTVQAGSTDFNLSSITVESTNGKALAGTQPFTFSGSTMDVNNIDLNALTDVSTGVTLNFSTPFTIPADGKDSFYLYTVPFSEASLMITLNGNKVDNPQDKEKRTSVGIGRSRLGYTTVDAATLTEYVDLGLPSGILWATCNVGASKPDDFGDYFAWGETQPYYTELNSDGSAIDWREGKESGYCLKTYCGNNEFQEWTTKPYNESNVLLSANDAANKNWGGNWRTPTKAEFDELLNSDNCTWEWQDNYNGTGHKGFLVTSKIDGYTDKAIFLPAAGRYQNTGLDNGNDRLYYSSSSLWSGRCHWYLRYDGVYKMDNYG